MKKIILIIFIVGLMGCTYQGEKLNTYINEPKYLIRDPHFARYTQERDELEKQYIEKKITYADYVEKRDALDLQYTKEVQERNNKISSE